MFLAGSPLGHPIVCAPTDWVSMEHRSLVCTPSSDHSMALPVGVGRLTRSAGDARTRRVGVEKRLRCRGTRGGTWVV